MTSKNISTCFPLVQPGEEVHLVRSEERVGMAEIDDLYLRTLDVDGIDDTLRRHLYREMAKRADVFLKQYGTTPTAASARFQRGYAEFSLREYDRSIATFEDYLKLYPFAISAPGARNWIDKARAAKQ